MNKPLPPELNSKCVELLYFQASNAYTSSMVAGTILAALFWNQVPRLGIAAWAISYNIMVAIRHWLGVRFRAASHPAEDAQRWLYYFTTLVGICGVIWGVYAAFLAQYADAYQLAVVLFALGALQSGAVASYSVSMPVYLAFSIPCMVPIALWLTLSPVQGVRFLGLMVFTWVAYMIFAAQRFRRFALESLGHQSENVNLLRNLEELATQLKKVSSIDSLTNLANRNSFDEELYAALASARQSGEPLCLILCDIDFFKNYNDAYDDMQGDVCLRRIARQLDTVARRRGTKAARIGGEEFAVILRQADVDSAVRLAEELRAAIEQLRIVHSKSQVSGFVTGSFGMCSMIPTDGATDSDLLQRAQESLHEAKRAGRNRVCAEQPLAMASAMRGGTTRDAAYH